jgi:hypothetical protein
MPLYEKLNQTDPEMMLYEIMRNPVLLTEFSYNYDKPKYEEPFELTQYQKEMVCDFNPNVSFCCARAVGKTVSISGMIIWALVNNIFPNDYITYMVPSKVHLEPVFTNLVRMFRNNLFLKNFIRQGGGINSGDFTIMLLNGSKLLCRIAGQSGTGNNVIGLHTPFVLVDEAGYYPWGTWQEMQPIVNSWTKGFRVVVSGVPTGLRERNVLYFVDQENSSYTKHRVTSYDNPRFSEDDEVRAIEQYGGKDTDDFLHFVLGKHGHPVFSLFDRGNFEISNYGTTKAILNGIELKDNLSDYYSRLMFIPPIPEREQCIFGIDLGYTEPTAIIIMTVDEETRLRFHTRIRLDKVSYHLQEKIIDWLDTRFSPAYIGMDKGNTGMTMTQNLQEMPLYNSKNYKKRLVPVDFSSWMSLGTDADGTELKQKVKPLATTVLQDMCNQHRIVFTTTDLEMISELERMTYTKTPTGEITYRTMTTKGGKRGEDHFTSALLCATLAFYLNTDFSFRKVTRPKLLGFSWLGV